jgi:polyisoprenoid-binding protein YceI
MPMKKIIFSLFLLSFNLFATPLVQKTFHTNQFSEAKKAKNYLKFKNSSKQFGFINHEYEGYALDFKIQFQINKDQFTDLKVEIPVNSLDTDNSDRNKKMRDFCFESNNYPYLTITSNSPIKFSDQEQIIEAKINVRGTEKPIQISLKAEAKEMIGNAKLSFKALEIPDPSIAIASIQDDIFVDFKIILTE